MRGFVQYHRSERHWLSDIQTAAKSTPLIEKGLQGPGLLPWRSAEQRLAVKN